MGTGTTPSIRCADESNLFTYFLTLSKTPRELGSGRRCDRGDRVVEARRRAVGAKIESSSGKDNTSRSQSVWIADLERAVGEGRSAGVAVGIAQRHRPRSALGNAAVDHGGGDKQVGVG